MPRSSSIVAVTSIVRNSVTCGAVNALRTIAAAVCLRTPLIGMRVSAGRSAPACAVAVRSVASSPVSAGASVPDAAASTSARVMSPRSPVPVTSARSIPRSRASLRTGGVERGARARRS